MNSMYGSCNFAIVLCCSNPTLLNIFTNQLKVRTCQFRSSVNCYYSILTTQLFLLKADLNTL